MKVKTEKKLKRKKSRPFLILPILGNISFDKREENLDEMPKNTGLKLFTKTWPPKRDNKKEETERPLTATLDKPTVLDIRLIGKIDMSTVRKEFLNISNLYRFPISLTITKRKKASKISRPLSLPTTEKVKTKKNKRPETGDTSWEDEESVRSSSRRTKVSKTVVAKTKSNADDPKAKKSSATVSDNNNNKMFKIPRKRAINVSQLLNVKSDLAKSTKLPEPCKTCGRPDQPERFHSHPVTSLKPAKKIEEPPKMKSTVQKPVAMKYKSKQGTEKKPIPPPARKPSLPAQKLVYTPPNIGSSNSSVSQKLPSTSSTPRAKSAKRTVTCYICGKEFGTASLPLHEPKCLQKWERENSKLPTHLQQKRPAKPDHALTQEEWNEFAWKSSQAVLTPCSNCGRTFHPDRLIVHQRSCKSPQGNSKLPIDKPSSTVTQAPAPDVMAPPPSVECYICGKLFGTHSVKIHERQCLKKWHIENEALPEDIRAPEPVKKNGDQKLSRTSESTPQKANNDKQERHPSAKKRPMFPCYICGRLFTVNSIYIHEPQCLKMWKIENDKLPPHKRRPQPVKPDIKFTHEGKIDYEATNDANWRSHLSQLVPCKYCSRTFNPDRVDVHERSCKG